MSSIITELNTCLEKCRLERVNAQKVTQIENERLQEILFMCQIYNENNCNQMSRRFNRLNCNQFNYNYKQNDDQNNNINNDFKCEDINKSVSEDIFNKTSESVLEDSPTREVTQMRSEFSSSTLNSRDSGTSSSSGDSGNVGMNCTNDKTTSSESLNVLLMEEALVLGELNDIQQQHFSDCDDNEDEDLREFQRIEREIKVSELSKCLQLVQKQINNYNEKRDAIKAQKSNKTNVPNDSLEAPLADSESYADGQSTETEKDDSPEPKNIENTSLEIESKEPLIIQKTIINKKSQLRPLTLYLPSPDEELNLVHHIQTLGHDLTDKPSLIITPFTCSGYLYKLCTNSESKWRKRFFHFDRKHKLFVYYRNRRGFKKMTKPSGGVYFDEIHDVYVDHTKMKHKNNDNQSTRCVFIVGSARRQFILSTFKPELMRIWIDVIFTGAQAYQEFND